MPTSNSLLSKKYHALDKWINARPHRERVYLLLFGCICIYTLWYALLEKPVMVKRGEVIQQIESQKKQLVVFQREIDHVTREGTKFAEHQKLTADQLKNNPLPVVEYATARDSDEIVKQILLPQSHVNFISLKTSPAATKVSMDNKAAVTLKDNMEITFNSDYFSALNYVAQLEKLPWCLSWDSLNYKVASYPNAAVVINLHIVNN